MTPQRVSLITLGVDDLERSAQFYQSLGWQRIRGDEEVVFFQINGMALGLFGKKALAKDQGRPGAALGTGAITLAQNFRTEKEVDGAFAKAISAGAQPLKIPQSVFWGGYSGYYADLDDHVWEMAYNPFWALNDDGSLTLESPENEN